MMRLSPAGLWLPDDAQNLVVPVKEGRLGPNLLINGHGEFGDKTGWTGGGYFVAGEGLFGDGCFRVDGTYMLSVNVIPINPQIDTLWGTVWIKRFSDTSRPLYVGMVCITSNYQDIKYAGAWRYENTFCQVYENYTAGSTTIKVTPPAYEPPLYVLALQVDVSTDNSDLPVPSSRFKYVTAITKNSDHWMLTLNSGFDSSYSTGTMCAFSKSGNTFPYFLSAGITPSLSYTQITGTIAGVNTPYQEPTNTMFRLGTAYVRFSTHTSGGSGEYNTYVDGMELRHVY